MIEVYKIMHLKEVDRKIFLPISHDTRTKGHLMKLLNPLFNAQLTYGIHYPRDIVMAISIDALKRGTDNFMAVLSINGY